MKNFHWYAKRTMCHKILPSVMMAGEAFVFRAFWIFR